MRSPAEYIPPTEVQNKFLAQFTHLREKIETCREKKNIPSPPIQLVSMKAVSRYLMLFNTKVTRIALMN